MSPKDEALRQGLSHTARAQGQWKPCLSSLLQELQKPGNQLLRSRQPGTKLEQ